MSVCRRCDLCNFVYDLPSNFMALAKKEREAPSGHVWIEVCAKCCAAIEEAMKACRSRPGGEQGEGGGRG